MTVDLGRHTIFLTVAGSQAHGTARPDSDVDLRGVCVAPLDERLSLFGRFEQYEGPLEGALEQTVRFRLAARGTGGRTECVVFDVAKLLALCAAANPNALELLFADERDWLVDTPAWRALYAERHAFLTRKVEHTFLGYALAQLRKIETHRSWLLHPPTKKPAREDFDLPSDGSLLGREDHDRVVESVSAGTLRLPEELAARLGAERRYRAARRRWDSYQTWKTQRNRARAVLEAAHGYDTKHAMHLVRLMRMGLEALETGTLHVRRPDAAELAAIRDGALTFDELGALAARLRAEMERAAASTRLPDDVDAIAVDALALRLMTSATG